MPTKKGFVTTTWGFSDVVVKAEKRFWREKKREKGKNENQKMEIRNRRIEGENQIECFTGKSHDSPLKDL